MRGTVTFRADLHCHTTCSDGTISPAGIIELACNAGLQGLAITDHDTVEAYQEALFFAESKKFPLISGVEFSAAHRHHSVHILAYSFALSSPLIGEFCRRHRERRTNRNKLIIKLLENYGMPLSLDNFSGTPPTEELRHSIGRPHIAMAMMEKGYVHSVQEAFRIYIGEGKPCYTPGTPFSVEETLDIIHRAEGLAIIAHPHLIRCNKLLKELVAMPFDGIEGHYARFPATENTRWINIGKSKDWIITGGSDFHGAIKPQLPLGSSWVDEATFQILYQHFQRNQF